MKDGKKVLLYDGTLFGGSYSTKNSDRTGVFFVVYNVFLQLMKHDEFFVIVYSASDRIHLVNRAIKELGFLDISVISDEEIESYEVEIFFSLFPPIPEKIENDPLITKYVVLYDLLPLALVDPELEQDPFFDALLKSLNHDDYYFAISEHAKKDFLQACPVLDPGKIVVTYLAAADCFYPCSDQEIIKGAKEKYGIPVGKPYVLSLCTLQPRKNLIHAVKTFVEFIRTNKIEDLYFVLGGGQWDYFVEQMDLAIEDQGELKNRIIKTGYIDDKDLAPLYSDAMFTVYVSLYEGFGLPILEAMQCGCPVITSNVTSMPEVIGDAGITVDPQDPVALKKAYARYYDDEAFRHACSKAGLERSSLFSWEKCVNEMVDAIENNPANAIKPPTKQKRRAKRKRFGKMEMRSGTAFVFMGYPIIEKSIQADVIRLKVAGVTIAKRSFLGYEIRTYLLGIPIGRRPNYAYIDSQINLYTASCADAFRQLGSTKMAPRIPGGLASLPFALLVQEFHDQKRTLRDELRQVDTLMALHGDAGKERTQ